MNEDRLYSLEIKDDSHIQYGAFECPKVCRASEGRTPLVAPELLILVRKQNNMSSDDEKKKKKIGDLQSTLQAIRSGSCTNNLQNISFFHSESSTASNSYQETDHSASIFLSGNDNIQYLGQFLTALAAHKEENGTTSLNLAFHGIEWKLQQLRCLDTLLDGGDSKVKQLEFQRNRFDSVCLSALSEIIGRNHVLKVVILSGCQIEGLGATFLAAALKRNETLEELQVWEDNIGAKGAEEFSKMIEVNSTLKMLAIVDKDAITASPLISAVLARNRKMELHIWSGGDQHDKSDRSFKLAEFTPEGSSTLRVYKLDDSRGLQRVVCALGWNTTVRILDMTGIRLKSKGARELRGVLEQNRTLKELILSRTCLGDEALVHIAAGLFKNQALERLLLDCNWFTGVGLEHLLCPLSRFSPLQAQANTTLTCVAFGGGNTKIGRAGLQAILQMLETNQTIVQFGIYSDTSLKPQDVVKIFKSLERNATVRYLSLRSCAGVDSEGVLSSIMDALQVNPWIEEIDLVGTPLHKAGKTDEIYAKLGQNGSLVPERDTLSGLQLTAPSSCRVFFCGEEFAGKSTLCSSISHNLYACCSRLPYAERFRALVNPAEHMVRAAEIKTKTLQDGDTKISIWRFVGRHGSYALHDLMFPGHGSPSFFFIISSLFRKPANGEPKSPEETENDLEYWMRFIVSNSARAKPQAMLPHITIVLTHYDKVSSNQSGYLRSIVNSIQRLRHNFHGFVELCPTVFTVDGRSPASVSRLTHHLRMTSKTILERVPQVYRMCNDLTTLLCEWRSENNNRPVMRWNEFCELCQRRVADLRMRSRRDSAEKVDERRRSLANSLHHVGEVIFFEELGFLVLDCDWFCSEVLGQLAKLDVGKRANLVETTSAFVSRKELEKILRGRLQNQIPGMGSRVLDNLEAGDLITMMLKLELCYEQHPHDPTTMLLIPALLEQGRGKSHAWQLNTPDCVHAGRRLECDSSGHAFLTAGFFPRLQVHLHNKIFRSKNQQGAAYSLEKNLISLVMNGIHVKVELGEQHGYDYYVDVLACSAKGVNEMLRLFRQLIIPTIQSLCPNITLIEHVIRPDCVRQLIPPRLRRSQAITVQQLKQALLSMPAESMYDYQHTWSGRMVDVDGSRVILRTGSDFARDLLSDEEFWDVLHRRYYDVRHLAIELAQAVPFEDHEYSPPPPAQTVAVEPSLAGIAKGVEVVLQRLKTIEREIKDLKQEIQGLRYYEHRLLIDLHRKVDYLVNYNLQLEESRVPKMFYFVQVQKNNYTKRLVTRKFSGMTALRLHMLCEYRREMHVVDDQIGCELIQIDNQTVKCLLPYMSKFMKLLTFALKIGAHLAAGMGEMIPDLGREVAHLIDSSLLLHGTTAAAGAGLAAAGALGAAAIERRRATSTRASSSGGSPNAPPSAVAEDIRTARQWLVDFLKDRKITSGKEIAERFGLWRVRYLDNGHMAWICRRHKESRGDQVIEVPI